LKDPDPKTPMTGETAEMICLAAKRLIESAELEIKFSGLVDAPYRPSQFLALPSAEKKS
jgi:hypothetical protein